MNTPVETIFFPLPPSKKRAVYLVSFVGFICALCLVTAIPLGRVNIGVACVLDAILILAGWRIARFLSRGHELKRLVVDDQGLRYTSHRGEVSVAWVRITGVAYAGSWVTLSIGPDRFLRLAEFENMAALQDRLRQYGLPVNTAKRLGRAQAICLSVLTILATAGICAWLIAEIPKSFEYLWIFAVAIALLTMRKPWSLHLGEHPVRTSLRSCLWPSLGLVIISALAYLYLHQVPYNSL